MNENKTLSFYISYTLHLRLVQMINKPKVIAIIFFLSNLIILKTISIHTSYNLGEMLDVLLLQKF